MKNSELKFQLLIFISGLLLFSAALNKTAAQDLRWMRVGQLQAFFMDYGSECELTAFNNNFATWPTLYGENQYMTRMKGLWLGCTNFSDPVENKVKSYKVVGSGPRYDPANQPRMIFPQSIKLIGKYQHPVILVDNQIGTNNTLYDLVDELDPSLPCDRMIIAEFNTSMGVSVTKKVLAFTHPDHSNYFIHDYVIKNTGIYNEAGDVLQQTLQNFYIYFSYRYAFAGVTSSGFGSTWGAFSSEWGSSTLFHDFGKHTGSDINGFYGYYGPNRDRVVTFDQDWGCPNHQVDGLLGSGKFQGVVQLFASKSPSDWTNDPNQPTTNTYTNADAPVTLATVSQYDENFMKLRYDLMKEGTVSQSHDESVGNQYIADWRGQHPDKDQGGGSMQGMGYGPYTLAPGDSIRIVFAEGANGISWEKAREVGLKWYQYFTGTGTPQLMMPDGSTSTSYTAYTKAWLDTGKDSIMKTLRYAVDNYNANYNIPQAPPAPDQFTVESGGNRISLTWSDNAASHPNFDGYVIYRAEGLVKDYRSVYTKIFECDAGTVTNQFNDVTAARGFNYYYYVQAKDNGSSGKVLYSSPFLTLTTVPAFLRRPPAPDNPIPPDQDSTFWMPFSEVHTWDDTLTYHVNDVVIYNGEYYIANEATTEDFWLPDTSTYWTKIAVTDRGAWTSGSAYPAYSKVSHSNVDYLNLYSLSAGSGLELVRVVPNPYDIRGRHFQFGASSQFDDIAFYGLPGDCKLKVFTERGDLIWEKEHSNGSGDEQWDSKTFSGQIVVSGIYILYVETPDGRSVYRKFVIIR